ncbi:MAG: hypothetical protein ABIK68_16805 [bacterium]
MKASIFKILLPVSLLLFLSSCGMNTVNVDALKKTKSVALISIMSEQSVDTSKVDEGSLLAMVANHVSSSDATDMTNKVDKLKQHILSKSSAIFGFRMVSENQVIGSKTYKSIDDSNKNMSNLVAPAGYKRIFSNEKKALDLAFKDLKGVDAAMIVTLKMRLVKGIGAVGVGKSFLWADMTFYLVDRQGNLILHKTASNESDTSALRVMGVFNGSDIEKMALESVDKDLREVATWMQEEMKKPAKKKA